MIVLKKVFARETVLLVHPQGKSREVSLTLNHTKASPCLGAVTSTHHPHRPLSEVGGGDGEPRWPERSPNTFRASYHQRWSEIYAVGGVLHECPGHPRPGTATPTTHFYSVR